MLRLYQIRLQGKLRRMKMDIKTKVWRPLSLAVLVVICQLLLGAGSAQAGDGVELMRRLDAASATDGERITVSLKRTAANGTVREARFVMTNMAPVEDAARSKIIFESPADVSGTTVLTVEDKGVRSQWVYLPEVGMVRKLANADRTESFASTDFTLEDLKLRSDFTNRAYEIVGDEEIEGNACRIVQDTAANPKEEKYSGYSKVLLWVEEGRMLVWKVEFYDKSGQLEKILTAHDLKQYGEIWRFNTAKMTHLLGGSTTEFVGTDREMGVALKKGDFAPAMLGD